MSDGLFTPDKETFERLAKEWIERTKKAMIYGTSHPEMYKTARDEELERLRAEIEKLRAALKPFKEIHDKCLAAFPDIEDADELHFSVADFAHLRAAAAAIRETEAKP